MIVTTPCVRCVAVKAVRNLHNESGHVSLGVCLTGERLKRYRAVRAKVEREIAQGKRLP